MAAVGDAEAVLFIIDGGDVIVVALSYLGGGSSICRLSAAIRGPAFTFLIFAAIISVSHRGS